MEKLEGCCVPQTCCQLPPSVVHVHHVPFSLFFFSIPKDKQPFFSWHGGFKERDHLSMFSFYLSVFIYIYDTHIYIFILFFFCCLEFHPDYMCYSAVFDNICFAYTCFVVMQDCCSFIPKFRLLFQSSGFYSKVQTLPSGDNSSHLGILHT